MTYRAKVIAGGKSVIPADLRRELGIVDGDSVVMERDGSGGITLKTDAQVIADVQAEFRAMLKPGVGSLADDLFADRRAEAERENADHEARLTGRP